MRSHARSAIIIEPLYVVSKLLNAVCVCWSRSATPDKDGVTGVANTAYVYVLRCSTGSRQGSVMVHGNLANNRSHPLRGWHARHDDDVLTTNPHAQDLPYALLVRQTAGERNL